MGKYREIQHFNREKSLLYSEKIFSFVRWGESQKLIISANFDADKTYDFDLLIPEEIVKTWNLKDGNYTLTDHLNVAGKQQLQVTNGLGKIKLSMKPLTSFILEINNQ
jgi:hypothetical protein